MNNNPLQRDLTWFETQVLTHSDVLRSYVAAQVETIVQVVQSHVVARLALGKSIRLSWDPKEGIAGVAVIPFAYELVQTRVASELTKLGLAIGGTSWVPYVDAPVYTRDDFRLVLAKQWGELSDEQFVEMVKPFLPKKS